MATMTVRLGGIVIGKEVIATSNLTPAQNAIGPKKLYVSLRVDNDTKNPMRNPDCIAIELPTDGDLSEITQDEVVTAAKWIKDQIKLLHVDYCRIEKATWSQGCEGNLGFYLEHGILKLKLKQVPQCVYTDIQDWLNATYPKAKSASGSAPTATPTANTAANNAGNTSAPTRNTPAGNTSNAGNAGTPASNTGNTGTPVSNHNSGCNNNGNGGTPANTGNTGNANNGAPTNNTGAPARNAPAGNTTTPAPANTATQPTQAEIDAANGAALFRTFYARLSAASQQHN